MNYVLEVKSISKRYRNFLKDVSFSLERETITLTEKMVRKTTILHSVLNLIQVDAGEVRLNGNRIENRKD